MTTLKKLSIIIPVFNQEKLIVKAINSIPIRNDIEIIVIDDGSTDNTYQVVKGIKREIVLLKLEKNHGVAYAENRGFDVASGKYLMRLDSDDYLYTDNFIKSLKHLDGTDIVYYNLKNNEGRLYVGSPVNARKNHSGALKYVRREFLGEIRNNEDLKFQEDRDLFNRLVEKNPTEKSTGIVVTHYNFPRVNSLCYLEKARISKRNDFDIVFYYRDLHEIGGIETWLYTIASKFNDLEIAIYYKKGHPQQIERLKKLVPTIRWQKQKVKCRTFVFCFYYEMIDFVEAENYLLWVHGDFKTLKIKMNIPHQTTGVFGVAKHVAKSFQEVHAARLQKYGLKVTPIYNPFITPQVVRKKGDKKSDKLRLISATRLSREKGWERMKTLASYLKQKGIDFEWHLYTSEKPNDVPDGFVVFDTKLDIMQEIANADYLVQLSDSEGMPYVVWESLSVGTPIIVTNIPAIQELKLQNEAIVLQLDMGDLNKIKDLPKKRVKYSPPQQIKELRKILLGGVKRKAMKKDSTFLVRANRNWQRYRTTDIETGLVRKPGEEFIVDFDRLQILLGNNSHKKPFVELVEEIFKPEPKKKTKVEPKLELEEMITEEIVEEVVKPTPKKRAPRKPKPISV